MTYSLPDIMLQNIYNCTTKALVNSGAFLFEKGTLRIFVIILFVVKVK